MYRLTYFSNWNAHGLIAAFFVIAALSSGGCTQEDFPPSSVGEGSVVFDAWVSGNVQSRGPVRDLDKLKSGSGFGVFAFDSGSEEFNPSATDGHTPNFMYNRNVSWVPSAETEGNGIWAYESTQKWPGNNVSFFAYAPYAGTFTADYGIKALTGENVAGDPKLTFKVADAVRQQIDLLYADATETVNLMGGEVCFDFKHALSRITLKLFEVKADDQTSIDVESITFLAADFAVSGDLNLRTGEWENLTKSNETKYEFGSGDLVEGDGYLEPGSDNYMMIIPIGETTVNVTVNYTVTTTNEKLPAGNTEFSYKVTRPMEINLLAGKSYEITLNVSPTAVEFGSLTIEDWVDDVYYEWNKDNGVVEVEPENP